MSNDDNGGLRGQQIVPVEQLGLLTLSEKIYSVVGATATKLTKPTGATQLFLFADKNAFRIRLGNFVSNTFTADAADNEIDITAHGYESGAGPFYLSSSGTLPAGLAAATPYWAVVNDDIGVNSLSLATTKANALANTVIDITDAGTGTHTIFGMPAAEFPSASEASGQGGLYLNQGDSYAIPAPTYITVKGYDAASVLTYYWI